MICTNCGRLWTNCDCTTGKPSLSEDKHAMFKAQVGADFKEMEERITALERSLEEIYAEFKGEVP